MRFRLTTRLPLKPLRAWFDVSSSEAALNISELKDLLCDRLPQLCNEIGKAPSGIDLELSIDEFVLLDDSKVSIIRDNDLICISERKRVGSKRRRPGEGTDLGIVQKKRKVVENNNATELRSQNVDSSSEDLEKFTLDHRIDSEILVDFLKKISPTMPGDTRTLQKLRKGGVVVRDSKSGGEINGDVRNKHGLADGEVVHGGDLSDVTSSSSESSSGSDTDTSDSDSDTSSTTSESSSSLSDSSVEEQSSKSKPTPRALPQNTGSSPSVPPGQGSQATHSRNARRRLKRLHEKNKSQADRIAQSSLSAGSVNALPLGTKSSNQLSASSSEPTLRPGPTPTIPESSTEPFTVEDMSSTLRNKNKKRGFRKAMENLTPQKLKFDDKSNEQTRDVIVNGNLPPPSTSVSERQKAPRLVTPSEKQDRGLLPANMFVTSVEVEGNKWDRKNKKKQRDLYGYTEDPVENELDRGDAFLDYGEPDKLEIATTETRDDDVDWVAIDSKWDSLLPITDISLLRPGVVVAWKELAINPATFCPESLLHLAHIKSINKETSDVAVLLIQRPGSQNIAFGAIDSEDVESAEVEGALSNENEQQYSFTVIQNTWRIVN